MAEGDTIHRAAALLGEWLDAREIVQAIAPAPDSPLRRQSARLGDLEGERVEAVEARGKHLIMHFGNGLAIHSHLGMRGSWRTAARGDAWDRPVRLAWLVLSTADREAAQFGGSRLAVRTEAELRADPRLRSLGPDVLAADFTPEAGVAALRQRAGPQTELGEALLDQRVVAGVGNIYRAEACFAARVSPWRRLADLTDDDLHGVVVEVASLMRVGTETGKQPRDVYRRAGRPCLRCGRPVRSRGQGDANRTVYWCEACQR